MLGLQRFALFLGLRVTQLLAELVAFLHAHQFAAIDRALARRYEINTLLQCTLLHTVFVLHLESFACLFGIGIAELLAILLALAFAHQSVSVDILVTHVGRVMNPIAVAITILLAHAHPIPVLHAGTIESAITIHLLATVHGTITGTTAASTRATACITGC